MKFYKNLIPLLAFFVVIASSCQRDIDVTVPDNNNIGQSLTPSPVQASLSGKVINENEQPVAGAIVKLGTQTTTTDSRGLFRFNNTTMDKYASVVQVETNGYFKGIRTFSATAGSSNFVKIKLTPRLLAGTVDAASGGAATLPNGSIVTLQPNSVVVKSTGLAYAGTINVYAAHIDPTLPDIPHTVPGSFQALDANNFRVDLKSYGMLAVQLESTSGELLQIATDKTAKLRFTIPSSLTSLAPSNIPLWSLNETDGLWRNEGEAVKTGNYYEGDVKHFSFWNCDQPFNAIYLKLTVQTVAGPLPNALVKLTKIADGSYSYGYSDSSGNVSGMVFRDEALKLEILSDCFDPIYSQQIGPFSSNTDLGAITVSIEPQYNLTISGTAVDCSNLPVANGNASVYWEGQLLSTPIVNGNFSLNVTRCASSAEPVEVIAIDNLSGQQSTTWTGSASTGSISTGPLFACAVSTLEYITYTIGGNGYSFSNLSDTVYQTNLGVSDITMFTGFTASPLNYLYMKMNYTNIAAGSTQQLLSFKSALIENGDSTTFVNPIPVQISEFGSVGQYIEGNFVGQVQGTTSPYNVYSITCNFKIKRKY